MIFKIKSLLCALRQVRVLGRRPTAMLILFLDDVEFATDAVDQEDASSEKVPFSAVGVMFVCFGNNHRADPLQILIVQHHGGVYENSFL